MFDVERSSWLAWQLVPELTEGVLCSWYQRRSS